MNRILIVEDAEVQCISLMMLLGQIYPDAAIDTAHNFKSAAEHVRNNKYDLYFLDVELSEENPDRNGYTIARLVRNNPENRSTPIVFTTAITSDASPQIPGQISLANYAFLVKPFSNIQILDAVDDAIELSQPVYASLPIKRMLPIRRRYLQDEIQYIKFGLFRNYVVTKNKTDKIFGHPVEVVHPIVGDTFLFCNNSHLINLQSVQSYDKEKRAVKINNEYIRVRRRYRKLLEDMFG